MRICFVSSYPPSKEGVGEYTSRIVSDLSDKNVEISVVTFFGKHIKGENNIFRIINAKRRSKQLLYNTLTEIKPDIIHVQYAVPIFKFLTFITLPVVRKYQKNSGCKLVVTLHEPKNELSYLGIVIRPLYRWLGRVSDQIWVLTTDSRNILISICKVDEKKVKIIPHGLYPFKKDSGTRTNLKCVNDLKSNEIILFFGYIHINKGIQYLIDAFAEISKNPAHQNTQLIIAGSVRPRSGIFRTFELIDNLYKFRIKRKIIKYSLQKRVTWTGYIENNEIYSIFKTAKIIVLPYTKAEQSGVLNIALASNRPIIASNIGGFHEMLKEVGILVSVGEPAEIAIAIDKILNSKNESNYLVDAYKKVQVKYSQESVARQSILYYQELFHE